MSENNETIPSVAVEIVPEDSMNLLESFEYAANQLQSLRERMEQSDRALYRTVGEFVDSIHQTIQNLAAEALDSAPDSCLNPTAIESSQGELKQLQNRYQNIKGEINSLLLTAYSNEEIDRLRNLIYLTDLILSRIQELSNLQPKTEKKAPNKTVEKDKTVKKVSVKELKSQFSSLKEAKEFYRITTNSWQGLADQLNHCS